MPGSKSKKTDIQPWRQDFRDLQSLPDIKAIRTHFLFNFLAMLFALATLGLTIYQHYNISVGKGNLSVIEASIQEGQASDKEIIAQSAKFMKSVNKVADAVKIARVTIKPERLLTALATTRLPQCRYTSVNFMNTFDPDTKKSSNSITLNGIMNSDDNRSAPVLVDIFLDHVRDMAIWNGHEHHVELLSSTPDRTNTHFEFAIKIDWPEEVEKE